MVSLTDYITSCIVIIIIQFVVTVCTTEERGGRERERERERERGRERRVCERVCSWSTISVCDRTTCVHACMWQVCVASNVSDTWSITFLNQSLSHASIKQYTVPIFLTVTLPLWVITYVCVLECLTASLPKLKVWEALRRVHLCETGHQRHRPRRCTFGFLPPRFCLYGFLFIHCLDSHTHTHTHTLWHTDRQACMLLGCCYHTCTKKIPQALHLTARIEFLIALSKCQPTLSVLHT